MELIVSLQNAPDPGENALVPGKIDLKGMTEQELVAFCAEAGEPDYRGRQVFAWIWGKGETEISRMSDLPASFRELLGERARIGWLEAENIMSGADGTEKFLWRLGDGNRIESVRIPMPRTEGGMRWSLCISTQVGCAMGCAFCLTAKMGFHRQLSASEIAEQFLAARRRLPEGERYHNVVFMGMGEPLLNFRPVIESAKIMKDQLGYGLSRKRITISTSGITPQIDKLPDEIDVALAISLHAPINELRDELVPINKKYPISELMKSCKKYLASYDGKRNITIEYVLIDGVNDSPELARQLAKLLSDIYCKINLIPFNPFDGSDYKRSNKKNILDFKNILMEKGFITTLRITRGDAVDGACGQLVGKLNKSVKGKKLISHRSIS